MKFSMKNDKYDKTVLPFKPFFTLAPALLILKHESYLSPWLLYKAPYVLSHIYWKAQEVMGSLSLSYAISQQYKKIWGIHST